MDSGTQRPRRNSHRAPSARHLWRSARTGVRLLFGLGLLLSSMTAFGAQVSCVQKLGDGSSEVQKVFSDFQFGADACVSAQIEGAISEGDAAMLAEFLAFNPSVTYVYLNLVGGDVSESIEMGRLIREWGILTWVSGSNTCASSCILIWLGGVGRHADDNHLKVHRFYVPDNQFRQMSGVEIDRFYQDMTQQLREYLSSMGVEADQDELIRTIMTTPPEDLKVVNKASHPRLFGAPTSRDQWVRANGCTIDKSVSSLACVTKLVLRDREGAGLLPPQAE